MARYLGQHSPSHATTRDVINKSLSGIDRPQVSFISLVPFLLIAFGLAWGILTLFIFLPEQMTDTVGELTGQHPLFFLAVYAPAIAALTITTFSSASSWIATLVIRPILIVISSPS